MRPLICCAAGVSFALLGLLLAGTRTEAKPPKKAEPFRMEGKLKSLNTKKKLLMISNEYDQERIFALGKGTEVYINGKKAKLEDLKKGDDLLILYHNEVIDREGWRVTERIVKQTVVKRK